MKIRAYYVPENPESPPLQDDQVCCVIIQITSYPEHEADVVAITDQGVFVEDTLSHFRALPVHAPISDYR